MRDKTYFCNSNYHYTLSSDGKVSTLSMEPNCDIVNVYDRFTVVLQLYFALSILAGVLLLLSILFLCCVKARDTTGAGLVLMISGCCSLGTCCYSFACLIILHVYRYQPSGKYASLDWMTSSQLDQLKLSDPTNESAWSIQYYRGRYLQGLVIYTWVTFAFNCCVEVFKRLAKWQWLKTKD